MVRSTEYVIVCRGYAWLARERGRYSSRDHNRGKYMWYRVLVRSEGNSLSGCLLHCLELTKVKSIPPSLA